MWVLIVVVMLHGATSTYAVDFTTKEYCEQAKM